MVTMTYGLPEEDIPAFRESVGALAEKHGASPENVLAYSYAELSGAVIGNRLDMARGIPTTFPSTCARCTSCR